MYCIVQLGPGHVLMLRSARGSLKTRVQVTKACPSLPLGLFSAGASAEGWVLHSVLCARATAKSVAHADCHSCQFLGEVP